MSEWKEYTVLELVKLQALEKPIDGNHGTIHPTLNDYTPTGIPFIAASDLSDGKLNFDSCKYIPKTISDKLRKGFTKTGDILLSHKATIGRTAIVQNHNFPLIVLTPQVTYYRILNENIINKEYLKYYFDSFYFQSLLTKWASSGSTRAYIGITQQLNLPIRLPNIETQKKISLYLLSLDNKIQLNNEINQTLEQIAQAIFKHWFIDFAPVHAKANALAEGKSLEEAQWQAMLSISGKTSEQLTALAENNPTAYQELQQTAAAFPSEFVQSELGLVPKGWEVKPLDEQFTFIGGSQPPKLEHIYEEREGYIRFIQNRDYSNETHITYIPILKRNKLCTEKDILMDKYGEAGKVRFGIAGSYNVALAKIQPKRENLREYLRWYFMRSDIQSFLNSSSMASTRNSLNSKSFSGLSICIPTNFIIDTFSSISDQFIQHCLNIKQENKTLAQIRDELLPKLLNGEIVL